MLTSKRLSDFPDLGIGVGLRPPHYAHFERAVPSSVTWIELVTENFLPWADIPAGMKSLQKLEKFREKLPVVLHGVSLNLGGAGEFNLDYVKRLAQLCERVQPAWVSDHLCWTGIDGQNTHDLLPLPYTRAALSLVVQNIQKTQDRLKRRILIENPSTYVEFEKSEMSEWEFISEVVRRADCGLLLDVNNVYVNSRNHGYDPYEYLEALPVSRIGQVHLAGHEDHGTHLIDTHAAPICKEVWNLYRWVIEHAEPVSAMIERDARIPEWRELEKELWQAHEIRKDDESFYVESNRTSATL
jgi:uncharacterized protein (UPF0276 family)